MTDAYSKAAVGYERIREILDTEREVKDLPGARRAARLQRAESNSRMSTSVTSQTGRSSRT